MTKLKDMKYKLGRGLIIAGLAVLPFAGCKKDDDVTDQKPSNQTQTSKTYTFVYDEMGIPHDTLMAHTDVDTFYVVPTRYDLFATLSQNNIHSIRNHLQASYNSNNKTRGKGDFLTRNASYEDSVFLSWFGYNVQR